MGDKRKPRVLTRCVANNHARNGERIVEFSHKLGGGLISFRPDNDGKRLIVDVYRCDETVDVRTDERTKLEKELALLHRKISHGCTDANCSLCDKDAPS